MARLQVVGSDELQIQDINFFVLIYLITHYTSNITISANNMMHKKQKEMFSLKGETQLLGFV